MLIVQDLRCTKLELPVLPVLLDTLVTTASVPSPKSIIIQFDWNEINNLDIHDAPLIFRFRNIKSS